MAAAPSDAKVYDHAEPCNGGSASPRLPHQRVLRHVNRRPAAPSGTRRRPPDSSRCGSPRRTTDLSPAFHGAAFYPGTAAADAALGLHPRRTAAPAATAARYSKGGQRPMHNDDVLRLDEARARVRCSNCLAPVLSGTRGPCAAVETTPSGMARKPAVCSALRRAAQPAAPEATHYRSTARGTRRPQQRPLATTREPSRPAAGSGQRPSFTQDSGTAHGRKIGDLIHLGDFSIQPSYFLVSTY